MPHTKKQPQKPPTLDELTESLASQFVLTDIVWSLVKAWAKRNGIGPWRAAFDIAKKAGEMCKHEPVWRSYRN